MKNTHEALLKLSDLGRIVKFFALTTILFSITGCGEEAVKIIIIPATSTGVAGLVFWFFAVAGVSSIFEPSKNFAPQQQQYKEAVQRQQNEDKHKEEIDLPASLNISDTNYIRFGSSTIGPNVEFSYPPNPEWNFHIYEKWPNQEWIEIPITHKYTDNMENGTYRVVLNTENSVSCGGGGCKAIIMWE